MDTTYKIIGGDGKEYGPVTLDELKSWISAGRVTGTTQVSRSDLGTWTAAAQFAELELASSAPLPPATALASFAAQPQFEAQLKSGASWFYWIAGLSAVNTISALSGSNWRFMFGLGITQIIDAFAAQAGPSARRLRW